MRLQIADGIAHLVFSEAARGNPIDGDFCTDLAAVANDISTRDDVRALLITAEGQAFSYGGDISAFVGSLDDLPRLIKQWATTLNYAIARLQRMNAPIVTAVHGICAGGMNGLVAGSDVVVASEGARFIAAYAGIGYSCDAGASIMLTRRMGLARARRFLLRNETLSSAEALLAGLVDEVVDGRELAGRAHEIARDFAAGPTLAYGEIRRLMLSVSDQPLEIQLELEADSLSRTASSEDAREGLTAFNEKRRPLFNGR